jgi:hypothetical protein
MTARKDMRMQAKKLVFVYRSEHCYFLIVAYSTTTSTWFIVCSLLLCRMSILSREIAVIPLQ